MWCVERKKGFTWVEFLIVLGIVLILVIILLPAIARTRGAATRSGCARNLKQWGQVFAAYAAESPDNKYPALQVEPTDDMKSIKAAPAPSILALWPTYLTDPSILVCPLDTKNNVSRYKSESGQWAMDRQDVRLRAGDSYNYVGWALDKCSDKDPGQKIDDLLQLLALAGAPLPEVDFEGVQPPKQLVQALLGVAKQGMAAMSMGQPLGAVAVKIFEEDVDVPKDDDGLALGNGGSSKIFRLRPNLSALVAANGGDPKDRNIQPDRVFVMFDRLYGNPDQYTHRPGGSNVLYLDGHVEFVKFPNKPPTTKRVAKLLQLLGQ